MASSLKSALGSYGLPGTHTDAAKTPKDAADSEGSTESPATSRPGSPRFVALPAMLQATDPGRSTRLASASDVL